MTAQAQVAPSALTPFQFEDIEVRTIERDGLIWFVASDIAKALEYPQAKDMTRILDDDEKGRHIVPTLSGETEMVIINESGLYHSLIKSRKPKAQPFRRWVTSEVLPAIRKTGRYESGNAAQLPPPEPEKPTLKNSTLTATFEDGQRSIEIQFSPEAWLNASASGEAFGVSVQEWLKLDSTKERIAALRRVRFMGYDHLVFVKRGVVWLHRLIAHHFAHACHADFGAWYHLQVERLINALPPGRKLNVFDNVQMLVSYNLFTGQTVGISLPDGARMNSDEGFIDRLMKDNPKRLMQLIGDYVEKGPSGVRI